MSQCDKNAHTQDHYMREKYLYGTHIRDSTYRVGCKSKVISIEHDGDMINSWDSYWSKLRKIFLKCKDEVA